MTRRVIGIFFILFFQIFNSLIIFEQELDSFETQSFHSNILDCNNICGGSSTAEDCFNDDNPVLSSNIDISYIDDIYFNSNLLYNQSLLARRMRRTYLKYYL